MYLTTQFASTSLSQQGRFFARWSSILSPSSQGLPLFLLY
jgi:hypothetical protein